jgi:RNA polymerase sigma-70 factor (ECF subfamily)
MHLEAEQKLVEAARTSLVAFGPLYERYVDAIYSYAWHRLGDKVAAEDIVSETFHKALENIHTYEWRGVAFSAWLYRIASNAIATRFRKEQPMRGEEELEHVQGLEPGPDVMVTRSEGIAELLAAVRALPAEQQQVILLRFGQDLRNKEIALIMLRSEGAVKALLHRALGALRRRLVAEKL